MLRWLLRRSFQWLAYPVYCALLAADWFGKRCKSAPAAGPEPAAFRPGLSVIIPERSNPKLLAECLESLRAAYSQLNEPYEVIVVASGSSPSLYDHLMGAGEAIRWVFSRRGLRFSAAVQRGLAAAQYDWVYLLNNDMVVDPAAIVSLLPWRSAKVFAIASQVYFQDARKRREETGWTVFKSNGGPIEILDQIPEDDTTVRGTFYAGGGASLFRRELLARFARDSSVYDPFYWEDVEWGTRAWRSGYQVLFCPNSKVWHAHRATNRRFFSERQIDEILQRNRLIFHFRNCGAPRSLTEFASAIAPYWRLLPQIVLPVRFTKILSGRLRYTNLPYRERTLEYTWRKYYLQPMD
jgi:hypothetical protein